MSATSNRADLSDPLSGIEVRPLLVIVSGAPATGKTTIVRQLALGLGLPLIAKDDIKEHLGDSLPARTQAESQALGRASYDLLFWLVGGFLDAGVGLIIESNFYRGRHEATLRPFVNRASAVLIHCYAPPELALSRYEERFQRGERHPVHFDQETISVARANGLSQWTESFAQPMALPIPTRIVDTSNGFLDDVSPLVTFIQSAVSAPK